MRRPAVEFVYDKLAYKLAHIFRGHLDDDISFLNLSFLNHWKYQQHSHWNRDTFYDRLMSRSDRD
jgi:hypothetical protein